ncbi:MAG TPA: glycerophosphodiester phosphodiesterase, partial [Polyangiaceae bacterium]|nr:glycerophosphodiester phosphodiesterase [Polyangiaceae bacterium]
MSLGCRYLETDVHLTRDGEVVVLHDARLERTTDGAGLVAEYTFSELRRLDAGFRFGPAESYPWRGRGLTVPRFEELLELSEHARLNVELKSRDPRLLKRFWQLIEAHGLHDRVLVAAAADSVVRDFRALSAGSVATSAGTREVTLFWAACRAGISAWVPTDYDALQVPRCHGRLTVVDRGFVAAAHARGLQVHVWTVNDPAE